MSDQELIDSGDLPGRLDPLFWDGVKVSVLAKKASILLIQRHLQIGYGRAAAILDAMVREGYLGDREHHTGSRPISQSAYIDLQDIEYGREDLVVYRAQQRKTEILEAIRTDLVQRSELLSNPDAYILVEQFAKKFGKDVAASELSKLSELLRVRGFEFSAEEMAHVVAFALIQQRKNRTRLRILREQPSGLDGFIRIYLDSFRPDDRESLEVLLEILDENSLSESFERRLSSLEAEVARVQKEIELAHFEKRLLNTNARTPLLREIDGLSGSDFEAFLADLFSRIGFRVLQTKVCGDQGADLVVERFGERSVIQAKRYENNVGNYAIQEVMAAISLYQAQNGIVVTNSYFTKAAVELAVANDIELIDRDKLEEKINRYW